MEDDSDEDALEQQLELTKSSSARAEKKRARIRAKEKRKKVKKSEKLRKEREAAQAAKAAKAEAKAKEKEAKAARAPPGQAKRGRPRKAPLAPQGVAESEPGDSQEQASQQIEDPALSAPRRPTLLEVPSTPIDQLPPLEGLAPEEVQRLSRHEQSPESGASCGPPPSCVTAFASLMRYVTEDLPAETSARRNAVAKVARHLGTHLPLQDVNQLLRQVQLQMMEKSGLSASRLAPAKAAQVEAMPAEGPEGLLPGVEPETESLKAVCKFIERHPLSGSRDSMKDFRTFVAELVPVESSEWQAAWQLGLGKLPDQERDRANLMLVTTMLAFSTDPDADRRERLSKALADFVRSHKVKLRTLEEAVVDAVDQVQGCFRYLSELEQVISSLLAYLYPAASNAGYGWRRPGWSFADWMRMVEKLLGRLEETAAVELLERTLYLLEEQPDLQLRPLRDFLNSAKRQFGMMANQDDASLAPEVLELSDSPNEDVAVPEEDLGALREEQAARQELEEALHKAAKYGQELLTQVQEQERTIQEYKDKEVDVTPQSQASPMMGRRSSRVGGRRSVTVANYPGENKRRQAAPVASAAPPRRQFRQDRDGQAPRRRRRGRVHLAKGEGFKF
ncbi:unnamed protein product [Effrenium voratum]|nr:unnamed protein product [Effrenium voratum]